MVLRVESGGGDGLELALRFVGHLAHDTCGKKKQFTDMFQFKDSKTCFRFSEKMRRQIIQYFNKMTGIKYCIPVSLLPIHKL